MTVVVDTPAQQLLTARPALEVRPMRREDILQVMGMNCLAQGWLDQHDRYFFEALVANSPATCWVAVDTTVGSDLVVGYLVGLQVVPGAGDLTSRLLEEAGLADDRPRAFVWQVCVLPSHRRRGVADAMLDAMVARLRPGAVAATVFDDNAAGLATFASFAARTGATHLVADFMDKGVDPDAGHDAPERWHVYALPA